MKSFEEYKKMYNEYKESLDELGNMDDATSLDDKDLLQEIRDDIYDAIKLPGNRYLVLQEVWDVENWTKLTMLRLIKLATILSGIVNNADEKEVLVFNNEGDSGYSGIRWNVMQSAVENDRAGIDWKSDAESEDENEAE